LPKNNDQFATIKERIVMTDVIKNHAVHFDFRWKRVSRFKNTVGLAPALHSTHAASIKSVNLCKLVGAARGPIGSNRSNQLKTGPEYGTFASASIERVLVHIRSV